MIKRSLHITFLLLLGFSVFGQIQKKTFKALRTDESIKIDAQFDEAAWKDAPIITDFIQRRPSPGLASEKKTEVKFIYDDEAIYVAAKIYEKRDNVFNLLTNRDNIGNSDYFGVIIDPFQAGLNGVGLFVTVAGVQYDTRYSNGGNERIWRNDESWNAVWLSETKIFDDYWTVEYKIPYAVLRFNSKDVQQWGINFFRKSNVINEDSFWNPIDPEIDGFLNQAGTVDSIESIEPPTRLFFYPYVSTVLTRSTETGWVTPQLNGGMDIKYGINDAFTLDMTLIPDFSGVRSDNQVLNLSPFEVRFDEQRQFFTEGVELFNKAGLFYSRRIGSTFGNVTEVLGENESITNRPSAAQLINASKITGRTNKGLGIGFFNAITDRTFLTVENSEIGQTREVEADPLTNFNVLVLDQNLRNNSSVTFTNTNVWRGKNADDANVSALNFSLNDKSLNWRVRGYYGYSQIISHDLESGDRSNDTGFKYNINVAKTRGNFQFSFARNVESDDYDINDLGFQRRANRLDHFGNISYNSFKPNGIFNNWRINLRSGYNQIWDNKAFSGWGANLEVAGQFKNFWSGSFQIDTDVRERFDFFEARVDGYVFKRPVGRSFNVSLRTDGRKQFRVSGRWRFWRRSEWNQTDNMLNINGRLRIGERAEISHNVEYMSRLNERGYVTRLYDTNNNLEQVVFGIRDVRNLTNTINSSYIFNNRMGVTFRMRHYWSRVVYQDFLQLTEDDRLLNTDYTGIEEDTLEPRHDRNFNTFNIDMEYNWQFAPGSEIRAIWKRAIRTDGNDTDIGFLQNFTDTAGAPNFDTITIRLVYFLDYLNVRNFFRKK